ncbi:MAG: hypothetical protein ACYSYV_01555 [Planctomycetota bacterium]|jgi:hypothetical protein
MRSRIVLGICITLLLMASAATAATVWNPAANEIFPPATGDWGVGANWTNDVPGVTDGKAVFNVDGAAECVVTDAQSFDQLVQGDNGPGGVLRVVDGGSLTTGAVWSGVGYNDTAHMIVETGGSVTFGQHMWVGLQEGGPGTLDIIGGSIRVSEMVGLGWDTGTGFVNVIAGLLDLANIHPTNSIKEGSVMDIGNGIVTIDDDHAWKINDYIAAGKVVGFGGTGTVNVDFDVRNPGRTTITAVHPLEPFPTTEGGLALPGEVELRWTLPDPCVPGQPVPVNVYFTDDYYALLNTDAPSVQVVNNSNVTSVTVTAVGQTRYYWAVDAYVGSAVDPVLGPIFSFWVGNQAPTVQVSADPIAPWLTDGTVDVSLDGTVTDEGAVAPTVAWSVVSEPNEGTAIIANPAAEDTVVTFTETGEYTLRLTADDGEAADNIGTAEITIEVFDNSCEAAKSLPGYVPLVGDLNADCMVDARDFALMAANWLENNAL